MTVYEGLLAVRARIADPARWCQGTFEDGARVCVLGAVIVATRYPMAEPVSRALMDGGLGPFFNDTHTHAEVIAKLDAIIASHAPQHETAADAFIRKHELVTA